MFFEGIRSERKLIEIASLNLAHRWYLGHNLDESLPERPSLSKSHACLGLPVFCRFFNVIVEQCVAAGPVGGKDLIFVATNLPRGHPAPTPRWIRSRQPCASSWMTISPH
jgi:hypothetical protein